MKIAPKVSVLIPTYNYAHILDVTIQSVLNQTFTDFELIIVDNCSKDNTVEVVQKYLNDTRVSFYKNDSNIGLTGNWNRCLELAKGQYIKYLCADDKFHPQILEKYIPIMDNNPNVSIMSCYRQEFDHNGLKRKVVHPPFNGIKNGKEVIFEMMQKDQNYLGDPTRPMIRRSNLSVGPFKKFEYVTDWEMWVRHLLVGDCYVLPEILAYGRKHEGQQQVRCKKLSISHLEMYQLYKAIQMGDYGVTFPKHKDAIDVLVKEKAAKCAFAMYKAFSKLHKKESRELFIKFFKIAKAENVLINYSVFSIFKQKVKDKKTIKQNITQSVLNKETV